MPGLAACERHPLLVQHGQTLHMRLPIMPMQAFDQASICFARCCLTQLEHLIWSSVWACAYFPEIQARVELRRGRPRRFGEVRGGAAALRRPRGCPDAGGQCDPGEPHQRWDCACSFGAHRPGLTPALHRCLLEPVKVAQESMKTTEEVGEQIPVAGKQRLLDLVLDRARREGRRVILALLGQFLPEPGHGAVEVMQGQALGPRDGIVLHPRRAVAVRARDEEAVQGGDEHGPVEGERKGTRRQPFTKDVRDPKPFPQVPEQKGSADALAREAGGLLGIVQG